MYLEPSPTSRIRFFSKNSYWLLVVIFFFIKVPSKKFHHDSIHPAGLLLRDNNVNLPIFLNARITTPSYNIKNKINLQSLFSINFRSFAPAFLLFISILYILSFAYRTVLETVLLFDTTDPPNKISKRTRGQSGKKNKFK